MDTIIYLIVGGKIRQTVARIVGKLAEVRTEAGILEFRAYYLTKEDALAAIDARKTKRGNLMRSNAKVTGDSPALMAKRPVD